MFVALAEAYELFNAIYGTPYGVMDCFRKSRSFFVFRYHIYDFGISSKSIIHSHQLEEIIIASIVSDNT